MNNNSTETRRIQENHKNLGYVILEEDDRVIQIHSLTTSSSPPAENFSSSAAVVAVNHSSDETSISDINEAIREAELEEGVDEMCHGILFGILIFFFTFIIMKLLMFITFSL